MYVVGRANEANRQCQRVACASWRAEGGERPERPKAGQRKRRLRRQSGESFASSTSFLVNGVKWAAMRPSGKKANRTRMATSTSSESTNHPHTGLRSLLLVPTARRNTSCSISTVARTASRSTGIPWRGRRLVRTWRWNQGGGEAWRSWSANRRRRAYRERSLCIYVRPGCRLPKRRLGFRQAVAALTNQCALFHVY